MNRFNICLLLLIFALVSSESRAADPARVQPFSLVGKWRGELTICVDEAGCSRIEDSTAEITIEFTDDKVKVFLEASSVPEAVGDWKLFGSTTMRDRAMKISFNNVEKWGLIRMALPTHLEYAPSTPRSS